MRKRKPIESLTTAERFSRAIHHVEAAERLLAAKGSSAGIPEDLAKVLTARLTEIRAKVEVLARDRAELRDLLLGVGIGIGENPARVGKALRQLLGWYG